MAIIGFGLGGAIVGLGFGLIYGVAFLLTGGMPRPDETIISPLSAAAMYIVACAAGGIIVGALRSLFQSHLGTAIAGILSVTPLLLGSGAIYHGSIIGIDWWIVGIGSILVGVPMGFAIRKEYRSIQKEFGFGG